MNGEALKKEFLPKYYIIGEHKFYRFLLAYAVNKLAISNKDNSKKTSPDLEFLDYYEQFLILYRREGDEVYLELARIFRKVAHRIYRLMLKKEMTFINIKFLNLV